MPCVVVIPAVPARRPRDRRPLRPPHASRSSDSRFRGNVGATLWFVPPAPPRASEFARFAGPITAAGARPPSGAAA